MPIHRILLCLFIPAIGYAQMAGHSASEKRWAVFHPFAAIKVNKINKKASTIYDLRSLSPLLDHFSNGGKLDAFRHVFFMAAFAQKIKIKKLRKLGEAHEKANYREFLTSQTEEGEIPDSLGSVMDLQNNELGFKLGSNNKTVDLETLKKIVVDAIGAGQALIMKRNNSGKYLDCNDSIVNTKAVEKKWNTSKCLVKSNYNSSD